MVFNTGAALLDAIVLAVVSMEDEGTYGYRITQDVRKVIGGYFMAQFKIMFVVAVILFAVPEVKEVTGVYFLKLSLLDAKGEELTDNIYWLTTIPKDYSTLNELPKSQTDVQTQLEKQEGEYKGTVTLATDGHISFFNRIKVFNRTTGKRILPVHYSDNYITLMPNEKRTVTFSFKSDLNPKEIQVLVERWN